jgi:flagellin
MPAVLNTNAASLYASKNLQSAQSKMAQSVERLSSGLRVNRAKDDAAGLGIASALTSQINGANQGIRNLNDGISIVQTAEGAIAAAVDMAQRISTLATQGSNGTLGATERNALRSEMRQLLVAIDAIGTRTKFSGNSLLANGTATGSAITLQVSNNSTDIVTMAATAFERIGAGSTNNNGTTQAGSILSDNTFVTTSTALTGRAAAVVNQVNAISGDEIQANQLAVIGVVKTYIDALTTQRSLLGAYQNQIEYTVSNVTELSANLAAAKSNVVDTDYASETATLTKGQILQQAATAMLAQANQMPNVILSLLK